MTVTRRLPSHHQQIAALLSLVFCVFLIACSTPPADPPPFAVEIADDAPTEAPSETNENSNSIPDTESTAENNDASTDTQSESRDNDTDNTDNDAPPGRIAFISPTGQLGTVNPNGDNFRLLTSGGIFQFPAWSPTNNQIAMIGAGEQNSGIFVIEDREDSELLPLYEQSIPIYLYWSPNGKQVSFIARHPEGLALHLAPVDGATEATVLSTGQPLYWQWLPDNEQAITHIGGGTLSTVDLEGNEESTELGEGGVFQAPALSPSGRLLAYSYRSAINELSIAVQDREADNILFEQPHAGVLAMGWSPAADQLAYISPTENRAAFFGPLRLFDSATGESELLISSNVLAFFWSPDGRNIAFLTIRDANGRQAQENKMRLGKPAVQERDVRPLVTLFIYDIELKITKPLYTFEPGYLFITQFLPFFDQYALSHRIWSPDSQHIVMPIRSEEEENQIVIIPLDGSEPTVVANGLSAFWSHR